MWLYISLVHLQHGYELIYSSQCLRSLELKSADRFGHFVSCGLSEFELVNWLLWYTTEFSYWTLMQIRH